MGQRRVHGELESVIKQKTEEIEINKANFTEALKERDTFKEEGEQLSSLLKETEDNLEEQKLALEVAKVGLEVAAADKEENLQTSLKDLEAMKLQLEASTQELEGKK